MNKQKNNAKGITLVALVITIIVLVILVGVTLSVAINTGLITNSKTAVAEYSNEQVREEQHIQNVANIVDAYMGTGGGDLTGPKTIAQLYDGINDPKNADGTDNAEYNEDAMHIGDYVNYTAGTWSETVATPTSSTPFTFGGYVAGQSRDTNYTGSSSTYQGWRIWDISEDKTTITLISAGCPEAYYHLYDSKCGFNSELILTGETSGTINSSYPSTPRNWSNYINTVQYASSARAMKKSDLDTWYEKYIDSNAHDSFSVWFPANETNKLMSTVRNGNFYILPVCERWL